MDSTSTNRSHILPAPLLFAGRMILNLAHVNAIELGATSHVAADAGIEAAVVYFASGDKRWFFGDDAIALRCALETSEFRTFSEVQS